MATVKKKELDVTTGKAFNQALNNSKLSKPAPPLNSKGKPKTKEPTFGGPLGKATSNLFNRISENHNKIMAQGRAIEAKNKAIADAADKARYAAKARASAPNPIGAVAKPVSRPPMDSKGRPKTAEPIFGGPLGRAIANADFGSIKGAATRANAANRQQAQPAAKARPSTMAPLKPTNIVPDYRKPAPKAAPVEKGSHEYNPDSATRYQPPKATARPVAKPVSRPATPVAKAVATRSREPMKPMPSLSMPSLSMSSMSVPGVETQPMMRREADLSISTKKENLFQRIRERIKKRQLARADRKAAGSPMKSTTSIPTTPTPSAPQAESSNGLTTNQKAMLDNYLSRKKYMGGGKMEYMGGGKMKKYANGGMIEKEGMKPKKKTAMDGLKDLGKYVSTFGLATEGYNPAEGRYPKKKVEAKNQESLKKYKYGGKMDKKKAFMEMIAKLKAKKK